MKLLSACNVCKSNVMPLKYINFVISRGLVDHMVELGFSRSLSEWIGTNLKRSGDSETWAFNLDGAVQMFESYRFSCSHHKSQTNDSSSVMTFLLTTCRLPIAGRLRTGLC